MSPALLADLKAFEQLHSEFANPERAYGECRIVSDLLIDFLNERGHLPRLLHWRAEHVGEGDLDDPAVEDVIEITCGPVTPEEILAIYRKGIQPWWMYHGHFAVSVGGHGVDFTARQFDPEVAFPLIWSLPCTPISGPA